METLVDDGNTKVWKYSIENVEGLYDSLLDLDWLWMEQIVYGKRCNIPRGLYVFGNRNVEEYKYSKVTIPAEDWKSSECGLVIQSILKEVVTTIRPLLPGVRFDSCLLNYYRDGKDYIAAHKDKEALGKHNCVVTISLGTSRRFVLKNSKKEKVETILEEGDVIVMSSDTLTDWTHEIPKVAVSKCSEGRISLTFRKVIN